MHPGLSVEFWMFFVIFTYYYDPEPSAFTFRVKETYSRFAESRKSGKSLFVLPGKCGQANRPIERGMEFFVQIFQLLTEEIRDFRALNITFSKSKSLGSWKDAWFKWILAVHNGFPMYGTFQGMPLDPE